MANCSKIYRLSFISVVKLCCTLTILATGLDFNAYCQLPAGFTQKKLTGDVINEATAMAHTADGKIFIAERSGTIKVFQNGVVSIVHTVATTTADEQGLLGITLHPQFASNGKCYIYYTNAAKTYHYLDVISIDAANKVTSSVRIMEFDPIKNGFHNGGALLFKDSFLYIAIGESNAPDEATKLDTYLGKILRLTEDGQPAPGNPYYDEAGASRQKRSIWAIGMRNPWKMALDPASKKIFVVNVGGAYEEINDVTTPDPAKNYNYGWDGGQKSGPKQDINTIQPVFYYTGESWGCAITSGVFFNPTSTNYPAQYKNRFYFSDWCRNWFRSVNATTPGPDHQEFASDGFYKVLGTSVGIDGNIYYIRYDTRGSLWRLEYNNNQAPAIVNQPVSRTVVAGDPVVFSVSASGGTPLTYQWQKNGVSVAGATANIYTIAQTTAADAASYRCIVANPAGSVTSVEAKLTVSPFNAKPIPHILLPTSTLTWSVGDTIRFSGEANDQEDGVLPASAYRWEARFFHKESPTREHWHPGAVIPAGIKSGSFIADNGGEASPNIWFRLLLTVTDSQGRIGVDSVDIQPNKVVLSANATNAGLQVVLGGQATVPFSRTLVVNTTIDLQAPSPQVIGSNVYAFTSWSHGGAAKQSLRVPRVNTTYTATYTLSSSLQNPYLGAPVSLPGKIEAENFDLGGEGIAYHDATTENSGKKHRADEGVDIEGSADDSGFNIGYVATGEWLEYTVNVTKASKYTLSARVANPNGAKTFHVELEGQNISGDIPIPITGGFQNWQTVSVTTPILATGTKVLRVVMDATDFNLNYVTFAVTGVDDVLAVSISSPAPNTTFSANADITISANATATSGTVSKVEFFQGTTKLGEDSTNPYSFSWKGMAAGSYSLTAKATSTGGQSAVSPPVSITVNPVAGGKVNLALKKPVFISSVENQSFQGESAVDGNATTRWSSSFSDPQWLYVDLGASYTINEIKITWENARATEYQIQVADAVGDWKVVKSVSANTTLVNDHTGLTDTGRYVRVYGTARNTMYGYSIFELEVYGNTNATSRQAFVSQEKTATDEKLYYLYPNPVNGVLTIDGMEEDCICTIINLSTARSSTVQSVRYRLDVSQLSPGMYLVEFKSDNKLIRKKFIKL